MIKSVLMIMRSDQRIWFSTFLILSTAILLQGCQPSDYKFHGSPYSELKTAPTFELAHTNGTFISFPLDLEGISLLFFGYTHCPDVCPATAAQMKWVFDQLGENAVGINFIFVSIDPGRDTPELIERFLSRFNPTFIGLYGDQTNLNPIKQAYGVLAEIDPGSSGTDYLITHTARIFLIDQNKYLRTGYPFATPPEDILSDLKHLLGDSS
jgi:protein SCO1/2